MVYFRTMNSVGIVGLGYVGLPLSVAFADAGLSVIGVDADPDKVATLEAGDSYIEDVPADRVRDLLGSGQLYPTTDYAALREVEAVLICLPTPLDEHREPDLSIVVAGTEAVAENLRAGALVVLESTTYPGTTREVLLPILEKDGRRVGQDFHLAFSPERVDPGNLKYTLKNTPKVVGGITGECARQAEALYKTVADEVHTLSSPESAEMSKLLENIFRGVNIALVNELAILCDRMDVDIWEVIEAASTKPFGFMPFYPGPGLGGHCIPVDPFYLSWRARAYDMNAEFIELAGRVNVSMPYHAFGRIASALNGDEKAVKGSRVLLLGASYKPDVGDLRESPSLKILQLLEGSGAEVVYHDPYVPELPEHKLSSVELTRQEIGRAECVVVATDHSAVDLRLVVDSATRVVDLRNAVRKRLEIPLPENVEVL
jgi:UDP-N-acetyl-D-glucosamine dehydrogenase